MPNHLHQNTWKPMAAMPEMRRYDPFLGALILSSGIWEIHSLVVDDDNGELHYSCSECGWSLEDFTHWMDMPHPPTT